MGVFYGNNRTQFPYTNLHELNLDWLLVHDKEQDDNIQHLEETKLNKDGDTMSGTLDMGGNPITNLGTPTDGTDATTKHYVDDKIASLGTLLEYKGTKATITDLPQTGNKIGDVWYVESEQSAFAWVKDATAPAGHWEEFGPPINLEPYMKKADLLQTTGNATDNAMSQKAVTDAINASHYTLPQATENALGGIKAGAKTAAETQEVKIDNATGKLYVQPGGGGGSYTLPQASASALGGVIAETKTGEDTQEVKIDAGTGKLYTKPGAGAYTLPQATANALGGIKADTKEGEDTQAVRIDTATGKLFTKPGAGAYTLPQATGANLGGIKAAPKQTGDTQDVRIDSTTGKLYTQPYTLPVATANSLGGIMADPTTQEMPVEIAINTNTHKLWGALMTAYNSPSGIGGVQLVAKTDEMTAPVGMDSDGKLWAKAGGGGIKTYVKDFNEIHVMGTEFSFDYSSFTPALTLDFDNKNYFITIEVNVTAYSGTYSGNWATFLVSGDMKQSGNHADTGLYLTTFATNDAGLVADQKKEALTLNIQRMYTNPLALKMTLQKGTQTTDTNFKTAGGYITIYEMPI